MMGTTAVDAYDELRERVRGGDASVTSADLREALSRVELDALRNEATARDAARAATAAKEQEADAAVAAAMGAAKDLDLRASGCEALRLAAVEALRRFVDEMVGTSAQLVAVRDKILAAEALAGAAGRPTVAAVGQVAVARGAGRDSGIVFSDGRAHRLRVLDFTPNGAALGVLFDAGIITRPQAGQINLAPAFAPTVADCGFADPWPN